LVVLLCAVLAVAAAFIRDYLQEPALHALPYGFKKFSLSDPLPLCGRWNEHMPSTRDPAAYRLYIEARKVLRSKIGWQLSHAETTRILTDVSKAAELGDWGRTCAYLDARRLDDEETMVVLPLPPAKLPKWSGVEDAVEPESDGPPTY
jgi:hypothetical protein